MTFMLGYDRCRGASPYARRDACARPELRAVLLRDECGPERVRGVTAGGRHYEDEENNGWEGALSVLQKSLRVPSKNKQIDIGPGR